MATNTLLISTNFTPTNGLQPTTASSASDVAYANATGTQVTAGTYTLAAAGTSFTVPVPSNWTHVDTIYVRNQDTTGYCALTLNGTSGAPVFQLAPLGGAFSASLGASVPSGTVAASPASWTLKSCDSGGVTANGTATSVYIWMVGH